MYSSSYGTAADRCLE